jgi:hypothetical protein
MKLVHMQHSVGPKTWGLAPRSTWRQFNLADTV